MVAKSKGKDYLLLAWLTLGVGVLLALFIMQRRYISSPVAPAEPGLTVEPEAIAPEIKLPPVEQEPQATPVPMEQQQVAEQDLAPAIPRSAEEAVALGSPPCSVNPRFVATNERGQQVLKAPEGALVDRSQKFGGEDAPCWGHVPLLVYNVGVDESAYAEFMRDRPPLPRP
jgi:hypothetical protein